MLNRKDSYLDHLGKVRFLDLYHRGNRKGRFLKLSRDTSVTRCMSFKISFQQHLCGWFGEIIMRNRRVGAK